jgi:hypothetical protein
MNEESRLVSLVDLNVAADILLRQFDAERLLTHDDLAKRVGDETVLEYEVTDIRLPGRIKIYRKDTVDGKEFVIDYILADGPDRKKPTFPITARLSDKGQAYIVLTCSASLEGYRSFSVDNGNYWQSMNELGWDFGLLRRELERLRDLRV